MEEQTLDFNDYLDAFKRRRTSILVIAAVVFVIGAVAALVWPATYKSSATILIKEQDIPPDLVRSTVTSFASQRIQAISQKVMARPNLMEIIDKYNLYADERERLTTEEIISEMRDNIGMDLIDADVVDPRTGRPTSATIAFQLSFSGENPSQVQKVANELMSLYLKENLKERSEKANETYTFLNDESKRLSGEIADLEAKLAAFKEKHVNTLPELRAAQPQHDGPHRARTLGHRHANPRPGTDQGLSAKPVGTIKAVWLGSQHGPQNAPAGPADTVSGADRALFTGSPGCHSRQARNRRPGTGNRPGRQLRRAAQADRSLARGTGHAAEEILGQAPGRRQAATADTFTGAVGRDGKCAGEVQPRHLGSRQPGQSGLRANPDPDRIGRYADPLTEDQEGRTRGQTGRL